MDINKATHILRASGFELKPKTTVTEAEQIVNDNGEKFVKESKKYAAQHPVFDPKHFQEYLLRECDCSCKKEPESSDTESEDTTETKKKTYCKKCHRVTSKCICK